MLQVGWTAPDFKTIDVHKNEVSLAACRGGPAVIEFLRYVGCPVCQMRIVELTGLASKLEARGGHLIAFVQSERPTLAKFVAEHPLPFRIVADPRAAYYRLYEVPRGDWRGYVSPAMIAGAVRATLAGNIHGKFEGNELQVPATFIVDAEGRLAHVHCGRNPADNLPAEEILAKLPG